MSSNIQTMHLHAVEYCSAPTEGILPYTAAWVGLEDTVLSDQASRRRANTEPSHLNEASKVDSDAKNEVVVARAWRGSLEGSLLSGCSCGSAGHTGPGALLCRAAPIANSAVPSTRKLGSLVSHFLPQEP